MIWDVVSLFIRSITFHCGVCLVSSDPRIYHGRDEPVGLWSVNFLSVNKRRECNIAAPQLCPWLWLEIDRDFGFEHAFLYVLFLFVCLFLLLNIIRYAVPPITKNKSDYRAWPLIQINTERNERANHLNFRKGAWLWKRGVALEKRHVGRQLLFGIWMSFKRDKSLPFARLRD